MNVFASLCVFSCAFTGAFFLVLFLVLCVDPIVFFCCVFLVLFLVSVFASLCFFCAFLVLFLVSVLASAGAKFAEKKHEPCAISLQILCPFSDSFVWCYFGSDCVFFWCYFL